MAYQRKPEWLKTSFRSDNEFSKVNSTIKAHGLHTICVSGKCPNLCDCWNRGTATFMILGDICTRSCKFCNTNTGLPLPPNESEPHELSKSIESMKLKHVVVTSVDRDDLSDGGAEHWALTIRCIKQRNPDTTIEVLIPDFDGNNRCLEKIVNEKPNIISHNLETVERLTPVVRTKAKYRVSLDVLRYIASRNIVAKTGIMLGLGETENEVKQLMIDAYNVGCTVITIGQYLQPSRKNIPVVEYIHPEKFKEYKEFGLQIGYKFVESAPLVRSSYGAEKHVGV